MINIRDEAIIVLQELAEVDKDNPNLVEEKHALIEEAKLQILRLYSLKLILEVMKEEPIFDGNVDLEISADD